MIKGVIDDFTIRKFDEGERKGIFIIYKVNGKPYTQTKIYDIDDGKIEELRVMLRDNTATNREAQELCGTIGLCTILSRVYDIVSGK